MSDSRLGMRALFWHMRQCASAPGIGAKSGAHLRAFINGCDGHFRQKVYLHQGSLPLARKT